MSPQNNNYNASLFDDLLYCVKHDALDDPLGESIHLLHRIGAGDAFSASVIRERAHALRMKDAFGEMVPFRKSKLTKGEIVVGKDVVSEQPIRIPRKWLGSGLLLVSNTGGGKSNLTGFLLVQIAGGGCRVWIVEMYKAQMRHLRHFFAKMGQELIILRATDWKCNILQATTGDPRIHLSMAVDLLVRTLNLPSRARSIVSQGCHELYRKFGIWDGHQKEWPCLFDLYEWVRATPNLNLPAKEAILDRLGSLLILLTPACAAYRRSWNPTDLARFSIVLEMRGTAETVKQILIEPALFSLFQHEVQQGSFNRPMDLFVVFEDGQRFFGGGQQEAVTDITPMDEIAGVIRGSAKGICVVAQTMQGLSRRLIPNLATKVVGRLGSHEDFNSLGADLALNQQQLDWIRLHLQPGMFVGQVSEGDWREPFLFKVPLLNVPSSVDDAAAAASVKSLDVLPTIPANEFTTWQPRHVIEILSSAPAPQMSETELRYLSVVIQHPGKPSSAYAKLSGVSGKTAAAIRIRLVKGGYLREHSVATGGRGRAAIVVEPLTPAFAAASQSAKGGAQ